MLDNLIASETGCKTPIREVLLGPKRKPVSPRTFRSNRVINATATKAGTISIKNLNKKLGRETIKSGTTNGIIHSKILNFAHYSATIDSPSVKGNKEKLLTSKKKFL